MEVGLYRPILEPFFVDFSVQYIYLSLYFVLDFFSCVCAFVFCMGVQCFKLLGGTGAVVENIDKAYSFSHN